jgi:hypothetical protein
MPANTVSATDAISGGAEGGQIRGGKGHGRRLPPSRNWRRFINSG